MEKKVLIIIVTFNGEKWIDKCIGSALRYGAGADVLIVDNASSDGTLELIPENVKVIECGSNLGFGAANNIGFEYAIEHGYDYVYLLNQDAYLTAGSIEKMLQLHSWNPQYGILSPFQTDNEGQPDEQFRIRTGLKKVTQIDVPVPVDFVMAAHWLISVDAIKKVGGFSPTFHHYGEDDNLVDRMHHHRYSVGVVTSIIGIHDRGGRKGTREQRMTRKCLIPIIRMSRPDRPWSFLKSALWLIGCSLKNFSLIPVSSVGDLWNMRKTISANRKISIKEKTSPFLNIQ